MYLSYNQLFEENYTKIIQPIYGTPRDENDDNVFTEEINKTHQYRIGHNDRVDFTRYPVYSIDPDGCKDADDAFSVFEENGKLFLAIHIADPTNFIPIESTLWNDIINRTTTKYLSNRPPIHMMPWNVLERSSLMTNNGNGERKYTISIVYEISKVNYSPINHVKIVFGIVKIDRRNALTYKQAGELLGANKVLNTAILIGEYLFKMRQDKTKGAKLSEIGGSHVKYDTGHAYLYVDTIEEKKMKQMIAEFAIFANSFVGEYLKLYLNTGIFRTCVAKDWLATLDENVSSEAMLQDIITNGIRADYLSNVEAHDLVGMPEYCHFTSPIRRLSDCVCHYLLKHIYLMNKGVDDRIPFESHVLRDLSDKCVATNRRDKKNQFLDVKFRLLQCMSNMICEKGYVNIQYYITSYTGLFLNLIICRIDHHNVHMSYTLHVRNYGKEVNPKQKESLVISYVNCFTKYDQNTIPELDTHVLG